MVEHKFVLNPLKASKTHAAGGSSTGSGLKLPTCCNPWCEKNARDSDKVSNEAHPWERELIEEILHGVRDMKIVARRGVAQPTIRLI